MKHYSFKMDQRVSTTYVPLQPPYQIIKYGKEIGMQIGTLIATVPILVEEGSSFGIETHSFPVVAYANKEKVPKDKNLFNMIDFSEGVVWNRVELRDVSTICLTDSHLTWQEFIDFLWDDIDRTSQQAEPHIHSLVALSELGVKIAPIPSGIHEVCLRTTYGAEQPKMVRSSYDDILALNIIWNQDEKLMADAIDKQIAEYEITLSIAYNFKVPKLKIKYVTDEEPLMPLIDLLNSHSNRRRKVGYISIKAINEYTKEEKPELQWEEVK